MPPRPYQWRSAKAISAEGYNKRLTQQFNFSLHRGAASARRSYLHNIITMSLWPPAYNQRSWTLPLLQFLNYLIAGLLLASAVAVGWILFFPV